MSIASEILRLQADSSAIANAIAAKGVTVPPGSGFDDYATLIGQISGGGGGGGDEPHTLPSGYTRLEYIENPLGNTAYLDIGFPTDRMLGYDLDYMFYDDKNTTSFGCILGARISTNNQDYQLTTYTGTAGFEGTIRLGDASQNTSAYLPAKNTKFSVKLINTSYTINSTTYTKSRGAFSTALNLYVFALNNNGSEVQNGHGRLYALKIYSYNDLVRDYVPCKSPSNVVGVYDLMNETFLSSANSSTFTAGGSI